MMKKKTPLAAFSTFFVGGVADFYYKITTKTDLENAVAFSKEQKIPFFCLGGGSNIVFADAGLRGLVLHFANQEKHFENNVFTFGAGVRMMDAYIYAKNHNQDFSIFSTIPGTVGGAVAGNAGLPFYEMKDIVQRVELYLVETGKFAWYDASFLQFAYRHSAFHDALFKEKYILWNIDILLPYLSSEEIDAKAKQFMKTRKEKQPWGKTGGSFFRNPPEGAAGMFLEKAGLKGYHLGGAFFSEKHANFMMSDGTATQADIIALAKIAKKRVFEQFGVRLVNEVRLIDEWGNAVII